jgi:membrane protease YdiL (CAAX protease family)
MRALRVWLLYLAVVFVGGALLAPWLYWLAQSAAAQWSFLAHAAASPFHRYVSRSTEVLALVGLWPLMRQLRLHSWRQVGWVRPAPARWRELGRGILLGVTVLAFVTVVALAGGVRTVADGVDGTVVLHRLGTALLTAVAVAVLEETLFRGALFGTLKEGFGWAGAAAFSGLVFAWLHFFERAGWNGPVEWTTGLAVLGRMLHGLVVWHSMVPGFFNLALLGAILAVAFHRTGALYFSIGLHGAAVLCMKLYGQFTQPVAGAGTAFCGTDKLVDGWLAVPVLLVVCWVLPWLARPAEEELE